MHIPIISSAREATVATHAWTKLYAQIMSWVFGVYGCCLFMALTWSASTTVVSSLLLKVCSCTNHKQVAMHASTSVGFTSGQQCCPQAVRSKDTTWGHSSFIKYLNALFTIYSNGHKQTNRHAYTGFCSEVPLVWDLVKLTPINPKCESFECHVRSTIIKLLSENISIRK